MTKPYVLTFRPILKAKVWGGRRLASLGKPLPPDGFVGESWEVADLAETSVGGGGGGEARSVIAAGSLAGRTLHDAMMLWGARLLGGAAPSAEGGFPLLVKYLDAREHLSVQVHPSPEYAAAHPRAHLKTECWYVLDAEPGSVIYKGVRAGVDRAGFERALCAGNGGDVVPLLGSVPAVVGDCHNLPSGTVHALGAGVLVAEVQTPSDTTFRVYDWAREYGRAGRELHIAQALACIDFAPAAPGARAPPGARSTRLLDTPFYAVDDLRGSDAPHALDGERCRIIACTRGACTVAARGQSETMLGAGAVALAPASVAASVRMSAGSSGLIFALP